MEMDRWLPQIEEFSKRWNVAAFAVFGSSKTTNSHCAFGSGATSAIIPHGVQANQFKYYVDWGMTPAQALQTSFLVAAELISSSIGLGYLLSDSQNNSRVDRLFLAIILLAILGVTARF